MNIIQQQEALKDLSDQQIAKEMQQPSGQMPLFLVSSEAKRRADLRQRYQAEQAEPPQTTVQEDLLRSIMNQQMAPTGIGAAVGQAQARPQPQMPAVPQTQPAQGIMAGVPGNAPPVPQAYAEGGIVRGFANGGGLPAGGLPRGYVAGHGLPYDPNSTPIDPFWMSNLSDTRHQVLKERGRRRVGPDDKPYYTGYDPKTMTGSATDYGLWNTVQSLGRDPSSGGVRANPYENYEIPTRRPEPVVAKPAVPPPDPEPFEETDTYVPGAPVDPLMYKWQAAREAANKNFTKINNLNIGGNPDAIPTIGKLTGQTPGLPADALTPVKYRGIGAFIPGTAPAVRHLQNSVDVNAVRAAELAKLRAADKGRFDAREERLAGREADLAEDTERDPWMALAEAGFAIAGGQSPHAMSNIATGAGQGIQALIESKASREARGDKLFDARTALEDAQEARDTKLDALADRHARGELDQQTLRNEQIKIYAQHDMDNYKITEQARLAAYQTQAADNRGRFDASIHNAGNKLILAKSVLEQRIRERALQLQGLRDKYTYDRDNWSAKDQRLRDEAELDMKQFGMEQTRLDAEAARIEKLISERGKERGLTERANIAADAEPPAVKAARAYMSDPKIAQALTAIAGAGKVPQLHKQIDEKWEAARKAYTDEGRPIHPDDRQTVVDNFIAGMVGTLTEPSLIRAIATNLATATWGGVQNAGAGKPHLPIKNVP